MPRKFLFSNVSLIFLIICENAFLFYFYRHHITSQSLNAKCLFASSICFGIMLICKFYKVEVENVIERKAFNRNTYLAYFVFLSSLVIGGVYFAKVCKDLPVNVHNSDIVPFIQLLCKRFLSGAYAYSPINDWGYQNATPTYLPMLWLPFTLAEIFHFDYRFISYVAFCLASLYLFTRVTKTNNKLLYQILFAVLLIGPYYLILFNDSGILSLTVELLIASYYMLLIVGINQKNIILQGLFISFCLLSRYSLVLWLPLAAFTLIVSNNKTILYKTSLVVIITVTLLYLLPFLSKDYMIFYKSYKYYDISALGEWSNLDGNNHPYQLYQGSGFAYMFYYKLSYMSVEARIKILQMVHLGCSLLITVIMGCWYWFKNRYIHYRIFMMGSFKIYLSVFLVLIQVPYPYLMIVGNFVSIAIFYEQLRYRVVHND